MATRLDPHDSEIQQNMSSTIIVSLVAALIAWLVYKAIYNLYFHPLAKIPGPWWASISYLAEIYYDLIAGGLYFKQIVGMHEQYGKHDRNRT